MAEAGEKLLKILCIHGYRQNSQTFRQKTGSFRKIIKKRTELVFVDAPNVVPPMVAEAAGGDQAESDCRGWWFSRSDDYFKADEETDCCKGYRESLQVIEGAIREHGPFDGVLGFSQGAAMVALICGIQQLHPEKPFRFHFAILVAGFRSRSAEHQAAFTQRITLPSLHVYGDTDRVIPKEMSEDLVTLFSDPVTLNHPGGHFVPASAAQKPAYTDFLTKMATGNDCKNNINVNK